MSLAGHLLPALGVLLAWFASTGLVVWLVHRPRATHRPVLLALSASAVVAVAVIAGTRHDGGAAATYGAAIAALLIWAWQEFAFLCGAAAGPRRCPADREARGLRRFGQAAAAMLWHELALAALLALLAGLTWGAANQVGAGLFALLFAFRLAAKLAIFAGVPNLHDELLPAQLGYLRSYFGPRRTSATLVLAILAGLGCTALLAGRALAAGTGPAAVAPSLLVALAALGALELLFLALPIRDGALWHWALRDGGVARPAKQA